MKNTFLLFCAMFLTVSLFAQAPKIGPTKVTTAIYFDQTPPLKELISQASKFDFAESERNKELAKPRLYPFAETALPQGNDPIMQRQMGDKTSAFRDVLHNFNGQSGFSDPLDNNGSVGPNHYMQSINVSYSIYEKNGNQVVAPTAMNTLFAGVDGAAQNDGDPIIMYDGQADRWFAAEFSTGGTGYDDPPNYMLIAISQTNDPTGNWNRWSFVMSGFPDYMKFGITEDSYLMGTNTSDGDDIYAFERSVMLAGGANPQVVQFQNPNRPQSGFHVVLPMDTDGVFPPAGSPGQFITINDDAWNGGADQLWIYDLNVDWANPNAATFQRTQTLNVPAFDTNFGNDFFNIKQKNVVQKVDAIPQILMNRAQMRVFGATQSLVCLHTVDVDDSDHAGIRWYELTRNNGGNWAVRQNGTYAPDGDSRWMGSIAQNDSHEISIGYNVSSANTFTAIRYAGQSTAEYTNALGVMDYAEVSIVEGDFSQTSSDRWGDYANLSIDPTDDHTFWFTTSYNIANDERGTKIASWEFTLPNVAADFAADKLEACMAETVTFIDASTGAPDSWNWSISPNTATFVDGTNSTSQNPKIQFNAIGDYTITLVAAKGNTNDTEIKQNYISIVPVISDFTASSTNIATGQNVTFTDASSCGPETWSWSFTGGEPSSFVGQTPPAISYPVAGVYEVSLTVTKAGDSDVETKTDYITVVDCAYCATNYTNTNDEFISKVTVGTIDNSSGGAAYQDFTNLSTDMAREASVPVIIAITTTGNYTEHIILWIDWDQDCSFEDNEKFDLGNRDASGSLAGNIQVPIDALLGQTRMRVAVRWDSDPIPCGEEEYGEAEDYTINVLAAPLPVSLTSFGGFAARLKNQLQWTTESEIKFSHFELERSEDGISFRKIGQIAGKGDGQSYTFDDENPIGLGYYRLKMMDLDGQFEYSESITIKRNNQDNQIFSVYPNPVGDRLNISIYSKVDKTPKVIIITDAGQVLQMRKIHLNVGLNKIDFDVFLIPSGKYMLNVDGLPSVKFVKR